MSGRLIFGTCSPAPCTLLGMPKKMVAGQGDAGGGLGVTALPTWQATGLSLAVIVGHAFNGLGAILFGLLSVGGVRTLPPLPTPPPRSRTTATPIPPLSAPPP